LKYIIENLERVLETDGWQDIKAKLTTCDSDHPTNPIYSILLVNILEYQGY
jgi:hypothetical protein